METKPNGPSNLIGMRIKGFAFQDIKGVIYYSLGMELYNGKVGEIIRDLGLTVYVKFEDGKKYFYPKDQAIRHLIKEPNGPLSWEEAKRKAFKLKRTSSWKEYEESYYEIKDALDEAAELYTTSRVQALEEQVKSLKKWNEDKQSEINLEALSCAVADAEMEIERRFKQEYDSERLKLLEENKRLQERIKELENVKEK